MEHRLLVGAKSRPASRNPRKAFVRSDRAIWDKVHDGFPGVGDVDVGTLVDEMDGWVDGSPLEGRAAMAALCEPRLLRDAQVVARTLAMLDRLTASVRDAADGSASDLRILRQALGYGWSAAIAADSSIGLPAFERWLAESNPDIRWIVRDNLTKTRLIKLAPEWVERARAQAGR
jgi:hypothetical protein